jgi:hypothetical protein
VLQLLDPHSKLLYLCRVEDLVLLISVINYDSEDLVLLISVINYDSELVLLYPPPFLFLSAALRV